MLACYAVCVLSSRRTAEDKQRHAAADTTRLTLDLENLRAESARTLRNQLNLQQQQVSEDALLAYQAPGMFHRSAYNRATVM